MPNPRSAAEWALQCPHWARVTIDKVMCFDCADAYARQQVDAFLEKIAAKIAAAIRALEWTG